MARNGASTTTREKDEEDAAAAVAAAPLFAESDLEDTVQYLGCERLEPAIGHEEGWLGRMDVHSTEADVKTKYGGGRFRISARGNSGSVLSNRYITIAGEPLFTTGAGRKAWKNFQRRTANTYDDDDDDRRKSSGDSNIMLQVMQAQMDQQRLDTRAREDRDREDRREREREREVNEERRRRESDDRDERRRKDNEEREERRAKADEDARQRDRDHQQSMLQMVTAANENKGSDVAMLLQGLKLGTSMGARDDDDDETDPDDPYGIAAGVKNLIDGATKEKDDTGETGVKLTGDVADKVAALAAEAKAAGIDADQLLAANADAIRKKIAAKRATKTDEAKAKIAKAAKAKKAANAAAGGKATPKKAGGKKAGASKDKTS